MTTEQQTVMAALAREGRATCYFIANNISHPERGQRWTSERVGKVMRQLKYRSLVEFRSGTWRPVS